MRAKLRRGGEDTRSRFVILDVVLRIVPRLALLRPAEFTRWVKVLSRLR